MKALRITKLFLSALFLILTICAAVCQAQGQVTLFYFWGEGCPHCAEAKPFLDDLEKRYPTLSVRSFEVLHNEENLERLRKMAQEHGREARGIPMMFIAGHVFSGFSKEIGHRIEAEVQRATARSQQRRVEKFPEEAALSVPFLGQVDATSFSLPVLTIVVAGLDSFNPCAFFVLFFLLSLLVHAHSRRGMLIIGGVFILCSGAVYFLFMAAWLNFFLLFGGTKSITLIAGVVALMIATLNIKDFFFFKKGVSLTIPERAKPRLFQRMRNMVQVSTLPGMVAATLVLSITANAYEVVCTAGFPMVYTRILTLQQLPLPLYYLYLAFYNLVYVIPLACIVAFFVVTLGSRRISEWQGRVLKLLSGIMMLGLALVLLTRPSLLNNAFVSLILLIVTVILTTVVVVVAKRFGIEARH